MSVEKAFIRTPLRPKIAHTFKKHLVNLHLVSYLVLRSLVNCSTRSCVKKKIPGIVASPGPPPWKPAYLPGTGIYQFQRFLDRRLVGFRSVRLESENVSTDL